MIMLGKGDKVENMWTIDNLVMNKKPDYQKLLDYGFERTEDGYVFSCEIMNGMFFIHILVNDSGVTRFEVIDKQTHEEYVLIHNKNAIGAFVGALREESEKILQDIVSKCYQPNVFKSEYARQVIQYILDKYNSEAEYLWDKFPNNAIFRESKTQKWFAALLTVEKAKLGIGEEGTIEIIDLKETPDNICTLIDGNRYLMGYHMNKKHWYSICLDGRVSIDEIYKRIDNSYHTLKIK